MTPFTCALAEDVTWLALDTAGPICSIAVWHRGCLVDDTRQLERTHNQHLLNMLHSVCERADCRPRNVDVLAVTAGPGSFTGVRIAIASAQALALAADAKVLTVSNPRVLAAGALSQAGQTTQLVTSIRSRGELFYLGAFQASDGVLVRTQPDALYDAVPDWWQPSMPLVGTQPPWWPGGTWLSANASPARVVLQVARARLAAVEDGADSPFSDPALPIYLPSDHPWGN